MKYKPIDGSTDIIVSLVNVAIETNIKKLAMEAHFNRLKHIVRMQYLTKKSSDNVKDTTIERHSSIRGIYNVL